MDGGGVPKKGDDKIVKLKSNIALQISLISLYKNIYISIINCKIITQLRLNYSLFLDRRRIEIVSIIKNIDRIIIK